MSVSYLINRLQPLPFQTPVVLSLNPFIEPAAERPSSLHHYAHPVFDRAPSTPRPPTRHPGPKRCWFAGAWTGYGHEDGLKSAVAVVGAMGVEVPWQRGRVPGALERRDVRALAARGVLRAVMHERAVRAHNRFYPDGAFCACCSSGWTACACRCSASTGQPVQLSPAATSARAVRPLLPWIRALLDERGLAAAPTARSCCRPCRASSASSSTR